METDRVLRGGRSRVGDECRVVCHRPWTEILSRVPFDKLRMGSVRESKVESRYDASRQPIAHERTQDATLHSQGLAGRSASRYAPSTIPQLIRLEGSPMRMRRHCTVVSFALAAFCSASCGPELAPPRRASADGR